MAGTAADTTRTEVSAEEVRVVEREVRALMRRIRHRSAQNAQLVHPDLPVSAYLVLMFVAENESPRACHIVDDLQMDKGAVSRHIALLRDLGLVESTCDPDDRRVQTLRLTALGRGRLREVTERRQALVSSRLQRWSSEDLAAFAGQLRRLTEALGD